MNFPKSQLLLVVIMHMLITITADSDSKASKVCELLSKNSTISNNNAGKTAKSIKKCLALTLDSTVRSSLETLQTKLPASIMNAVFLSKACVKNKRFNEYLYVPETGFKYDNEKRRLFTMIGSNLNNIKRDFQIIPAEGNYFYIVAANHNEYLFADGTNSVKDSRRRVFTWEPDWEDDRQAFNDRQALWEFEPVDKTGRVYIKNRQYGEYLYAGETDLAYDNERRTIFVWSSMDNGCYRHDQCIWEILPC